MLTDGSRQAFAYGQIRSRVLDGTYGPGYRLVISVLARELGTSAIPVREALRRLEAEGLIEYTHNSGAIVTRTSGQDYIDVLDTLAVLEGYATAEAAPHMGAAEIDKLKTINAAMESALEDVDLQRFGHLNQDFHFAIYDACPNEFLVESIRAAWIRLDNVRRTKLALLPGRGRSSIAEHAGLIEAIERRLPFPQLEAAARQHKLATIQAFKQWQLEGGG